MVGDLVHDLSFFVLARVVDAYVQHEAIDLRLGERVGSFLLDRDSALPSP